MTLVWTRGASDWDEDRALLAGIGGVVRVPCVRLVGLPAAPTKHYDVYVVASAHTLAYFRLPAGAQVHAFGAATAAAAARAGARVERHEGLRTAAELASKLLILLDKNTIVAVPGAEAPAFDLTGALCAGGLAAEAIACYRTEAGATHPDGAAFSDEEARAFMAKTRGVVCFASPSAVAGFCAAFPRTELAAACIGPTTAKAAAPRFTRTATASKNSLAGLIAAARPYL